MSHPPPSDAQKSLEERLSLRKESFDALCGFRVIQYGEGKAKVELDVTPTVQNPLGFLHGGCIATMVDHVGTIAIMSAHKQGLPGVTTDLNATYLAPAAAGSTVVADAQVLKVGKTLAFVTVDIRRAADGVLVAQGRMTKFMG
jgi:acyl-coenzyme A thioesterase 13